MNRGLRFAVTLGAAAALTVACGGGGNGAAPAPAPAPASGTSAPATRSPAASATTSAVPGGGGAASPTHSSAPQRAWTTGPTRVEHHPAVPPVPVVTGVRYAAHPSEGYDRIVFDISGALPGYSVRYVSEVRADPSDQPVSVPGRRHLLIVLTPAQAHRDDGAATISGVHRIDLPVLTAYAVVGDYEGYVSIALGLPDVAGYRVGELPGRIYLDLAA